MVNLPQPGEHAWGEPLNEALEVAQQAFVTAERQGDDLVVRRGDGTSENLGRIKGDDGEKGDTGDRGLPGTNGVATDTAVATNLADSSTETGAAAREALVPVRKRIHGGVMPAPQRVPTLAVVDSWPNVSALIERVLWQENAGQTLYGMARDSSLYKSTDGGRTWAHRAYLNWGPAHSGAFLKLSTGTLLTIATGNKVRRSTDDGATWTEVASLQAGPTPLGTQSWCVDKVTGHIYYGEYGGTAVINLYRSTDDGLTWPVFHEFQGSTSSDPDGIFHIHAVQWDHISQRVWVCTGDVTPATGLYRVNDARTGVIPMVTNRMLPAEQLDAPRAIGIMPFPDYIAWASDSTTNPWLFRVARSELGKPNPVVERVYRINSTGWWSCRASADGSRWVFSSAQEGRGTIAVDKQVHLYAVEDQGSTVYEVAMLAQLDDTAPAGSLMPIGLPEDQGDFLFLAARGVGRDAQWKLRLGTAGGAALPFPRALPPVPGWKSANSGPVTLAIGESRALLYDIAPAFARQLRIFDANVRSTDGSSGRLVIEVVDETDGTVYYTFSGASARQTSRREWAPFVHEVNVLASRWVIIRARNVHTGVSVSGLVGLTYGWGA